jgi:hypothetical protein
VSIFEEEYYISIWKRHHRSFIASDFRATSTPLGEGDDMFVNCVEEFCVGLFIFHFRNRSLSDLSELSRFEILIGWYMLSLLYQSKKAHYRSNKREMLD